MIYDCPTPGLEIHLRYMHFDLDPRSLRYLLSQEDYDTPDPEKAYHFGSHRLPTSNFARTSYLWRSIPKDLTFIMPGIDASVRAIGEFGCLQTDVSIRYTEELMLA
jgi:hypothetical protein